MPRRVADEMLEHRVQPAEKKSQRNDERHFRFPVCPFTKSNWDFMYAQRSSGAQHRLKNNFETAGLWLQFEQPGTADGKEAAHRVIKSSERLRKRRPRSRHDSSPYRPA